MPSVRIEEGRPTGFEPVPRGSRPRMLPLHHSHHAETGTTGLEPAAYRLTSERSTAELRPHCMHGAGGIRTHVLELMRLARTAAPLPRKVWPAGVEPAVSGARSRRGGHAPPRPDELKYPRRE